MTDRTTPAARRSTRTRIAAAAAAVAVGLVGGAAWAVISPGEASATEVGLEPTSFAGPNPFMPAVGQDQPGVTPPAGTAGAFSGDTRGLFAEADDRPSCDSPALIGNLQGDPTKAGAWAEALGLTAADIPSYVGSLTPVVLRSDTAVTNHRFENGTFTAVPAVFQAGTAVFINSFGEPKVKCFSGNPLTRGVSVPDARYEGPTWTTFAPTTVTIIYRPKIVIKNYTFVEVEQGVAVERPAKPPTHDDDNWFCRRNPGSEKCGKTSTRGDTSNPALQQAVDQAQQAADEAEASASAARARADQAAAAARTSETDAARLETEAAQLAAAADADPTDAAKRAAADDAAARARAARQDATDRAAASTLAEESVRQAEEDRKLADEQVRKTTDAAAENIAPPLTSVERAALCTGAANPDPRCALPVADPNKFSAPLAPASGPGGAVPANAGAVAPPASAPPASAPPASAPQAGTPPTSDQASSPPPVDEPPVSAPVGSPPAVDPPSSAPAVDPTGSPDAESGPAGGDASERAESAGGRSSSKDSSSKDSSSEKSGSEKSGSEKSGGEQIGGGEKSAGEKSGDSTEKSG